MFEAGKSAEDVGSWSSSIEEPIAEADEEVSRLEKWLVETNGEIEHRKQKDEEERKARALEEELKFEREQMEMKLEFANWKRPRQNSNLLRRLIRVNKGRQSH